MNNEIHYMLLSSHTIQLLKKYRITLHSGFLPPEDPLLALPEKYAFWDRLNAEMVDLLREGTFHQQVDQMPELSVEDLNARELDRAMLLLSGIAHAYVKGRDSGNEIPRQVAVPWVTAAKKLGRYPILSHASLVMQNWQRIDPQLPFALSNLKTAISFTGTRSESWFFLVTANIEKVGAKAIPLVLESVYQAKEGQIDRAKAYLQEAIPVLKELHEALKLMYSECEPQVFFHQLRPFIESFENVRYHGVEPELHSYAGGSAAQSSLLQFFDLAMGIDYADNPGTQRFLLEMRQYMPQPHREFLNFVEKDFNLIPFKEVDVKFDALCKEVIELLIAFRNEHLKMVSQYIIRPAREAGASSKGTGGSNPLKFLKSIRNRNQDIIDGKTN